MRTVWKQPLKLYDGVQHLELPVGATIIAVGEQQNEPTIWYDCDSESPKEERRFIVRGTGAEIQGKHVGSCETHGGHFVWHVFELTNDLCNP